MSEHPREREKRTNPAPADPGTESQEETFSLEEIMREFGGWSKREAEPSSEENPSQVSTPGSQAPIIQLHSDLVMPETARQEERQTGAEPVEKAKEPQPKKRQEESRQEGEHPAPVSGVHPVRHQDRTEKTAREEGASGASDGEPGATGGEDTPEGETQADVKIWTWESESQKRNADFQGVRKKGTPFQAQERNRPLRAPGQQDQPAGTKKREKTPKQLPDQTRNAQKAPSQTKAPKELPTLAQAYAEAGTALPFVRLRIGLLALVCVLAVVGMILGQTHWKFGVAALQGPLGSMVQLALLLLAAVLAPEVLLAGLRQFLHLRLNLEGLVLCAAVVMGVHGAVTVKSGQLPFCVVGCLGLWLCLWSREYRRIGRRLSLKALQTVQEPVGVCAQEKGYSGFTCLLRTPREKDTALPGLLGPDVAERAMGIYAPFAIVISLVLALWVWQKTGNSFLWAWAAMLCGSLPVAGGLVYARPFALLARRLYRSGAILCGWQGTKTLHKGDAVVLADGDLFPSGNLSMSGMKIFGDYNVSQAVGYATAVITQGGGSYLPLFQQLMEDQNGRHYTVDQFRRYESGGLGAEIQADVVLVGSLGFMQLMGVHMPEGTKVKQAVYLSINGELAGVFAIHYGMSGGAKNALAALGRSRKLTFLLALRDFMITPSLIHKKYQVPTNRLEYPPVEERSRLSQWQPTEDMPVGAILSRDTFPAYGEVILGSRTLWTVAWLGTILCVASGILGLGMMAFLTYLGATATACGLNAMVYSLLWLLPVWLLTRWVKA